MSFSPEYNIESTLPVIRANNDIEREPLDKLATFSHYDSTNPEYFFGRGSTKTIGTVNDDVMGINANHEAIKHKPVQCLEVIIDSNVDRENSSSLEIAFSTKMMRLGQQGEPGLITTRSTWQQTENSPTPKINNGLTILANMAKLNIQSTELNQADYIDYTKPHARIFNAAAYFLLPGVGPYPPSSPNVITAVVRDRKNEISYLSTQAEMGIYALRTLLNTGIEKHSEALANRYDGNTPVFFKGMNLKQRTELIQAITGTSLTELGKKNVYGFSAGDALYDAWVKKENLGNPPRTIFDIVHADQREKTNAFFEEIVSDNYQIHASYLEGVFNELIEKRTNPWDALSQTNDLSGLTDLRDAATLFFLNKLYPHLSVYSRCEYVDVLNPAMLRTIQSYCRDQNIDSESIIMDIVDIQHNLLSVIIDQNTFEPIIRHDLRLDKPLTIDDFKRGQLMFEAGDIRIAGMERYVDIVNFINTVNAKIKDLNINRS